MDTTSSHIIVKPHRNDRTFPQIVTVAQYHNHAFCQIMLVGVQSTNVHHILTYRIQHGDVFYLDFILCVFRKKALSEVFLMALLPCRSWKELEGINAKYKDGKLKGQRPSLSEVLSTPSIKQIHFRCLSGLTPEERHRLLTQASNYHIAACNQISFQFLFFCLRFFLIDFLKHILLV